MEITRESLIPFIGNKFRDLLQSGTNRLAEEIVQACKNKISDYLEVEFDRNNKTKTILHRHEPIELEKFYQPLFLMAGVDNWLRVKASLKSKKIPTTNVEDIFAKGNCVTIIGTAGSGKSTLVKYLFVNAIKSDYKIPIKVELRYLNEYNNGLIPYIKDEIIKFTEIAKCDEVVDRMLSAGAFIFFFDGYDEVASAKKESITKDICKMTKKYNSNLYVLTSRPFVNVDMLEGFVNYQVCDLCDSEIESFIKKQFDDSEQELADRMIQTIIDESSKAYRSFLSNPLLLSMFIVTYQTDSNIPQKRCDYYEQVFNTLYSLHDTSSKLGYVRERKTGLSKENIMEILKRFSFTSYFDQKYSFTLGYFENQLNGLKEDLHLSFSNEDFIEDTEVAIGILTQDGLEITFPHRSLQEYFAALFVTTISDSNKKMMYGFLFQYFERSCYLERTEDKSNFFSLLFEMDSDRFKRQLVIPLLKKEQKLKENGGLDHGNVMLECFLCLRMVSYYVNSSMVKLFDNVFVDLAIGKTPLRLLKKNVLSFLNEFNIIDIINEIENDIAESENKDARYIKSMISRERLKTSGTNC